MIDSKTGLGFVNAAKQVGKSLAHYIFRGLEEVDCRIQPLDSDIRLIDFVFRNTYGSNIIIESVIVSTPSNALFFYREHTGSIRAEELWFLQVNTDIRHKLAFKIVWRPVGKLRDGNTRLDKIINAATSDFGKRVSLNSAQMRVLPTELKQGLT